MRTTADRYPETAILSIHRGELDPHPSFPAHAHAEPLLLWSATATVTVTTTVTAGSATAAGTAAAGGPAPRDWLVPPGCGLWIPGWVEHTVATLRAGELGLVEFAPDQCPVAWSRPTGVVIEPLLRELLTHLGRTAAGEPSRRPAEALVFELLSPLPTNTIDVRIPRDPRIRPIAEHLIADPADRRELAEWAVRVHAGVRTLSRLFATETGLTFAQWRTQLRVRSAARLLADGASVDATARAVGYRKTSAFIEAFRRATGQTPGAYRVVATERTWPRRVSRAG